MKTVYTLTTNTFGEPRLFGVYKDAKGAALAFEHLSIQADPNDQFRIQCMPIEKAEQVQECLDHCRAKKELEAVLEAADESN